MLTNCRLRNPFLRAKAFHIIVPGMRFFAAMGIFVAFSVAIAAGIVLMVKGSPWLLLVSLAFFGLLFARIGCTEH